MTQFTIRNLTPQDFEQVYQVAKRSWLFTYKDIFDQKFIEGFVKKHYSPVALKNHLEWVKENGGWSKVVENQEGKIVGFCFIGPFKNSLWRLWRIYLDPEFIGQGIGSSLLQEGEKFLKDSGIDQYIVFVHPKNKIGISFYQKMGFTRVPEESQEKLYSVSPKEEIGFIKTL